MQTKFEQNIISLYGKRGQIWLKLLPRLVQDLSTEWNLSGLIPLDNLSYNYILSGWQGKEPVILKLIFDAADLIREEMAISAFSNNGMTKVLRSKKHALLLKRAIPGTSLKEFFPDRDSEAIEILCDLIKKLHADIRPEGQVMLHGDLHHDNILLNGGSWIAIDPKGITNELAFEATAFIINPISELAKHPDAGKIISRRIKKLAVYFNITEYRMKQLTRDKTEQCLKWAIEDGVNESCFKRLLHIMTTTIDS